MKQKFLTSLATIAFISPGFAVPVKNVNKQTKVDTTPKEAVCKPKDESGAKSTADTNVNRIPEAMQALATAKDEEALQFMKNAAASGGNVSLTPDQATALIQRAIDKGLIPAQVDPMAQAAQSDGSSSDAMGRFSEAFQALVAAKDPDALAMSEKAKQNEGKLEVTSVDMEKTVKRAIEKGLIPAKSSGVTAANPKELAAKVLPLLAQKGDTKAVELLAKAKENNNQLKMTQDDVDDLVKRAKDAGILPKADNGTIAQAIQALAEKGDTDAKTKLDAAKQNGGALAITPEEGEAFVKKAKEQGLVK